MNNKQIASLSLRELTESQRYGLGCQPIVDLKSKEIIAYECLYHFY